MIDFVFDGGIITIAFYYYRKNVEKRALKLIVKVFGDYVMDGD